MEQLFVFLSESIYGTPAMALGAAVLWGVLSILLSPCHLTSIPLIVGFIGSQEQMTSRRAFWTSTLFSLGILTTIGIIGIITAGLGRMAGDIGGFGNYLVAGLFFLVGLALLDVLPMPFSAPSLKAKRKGLLAALGLGLIFGLALGPCTFAFMAPVLGISFQVGGSAPLYAASLLLAYGLGHCSVIVIAGTSAEWVQRYLNWNSSSKRLRILKGICGVLVIAGGFYLLFR